MFCAALTAPVTMCTFASRRTPDHADRMADVLLTVDDELLRLLVEHALVGRNGHRAGGVEHVIDVGLADLTVADRRRAVRVARPRMWLPEMPA